VSTITAAILVGGRARRLDGQLKAALSVGDRTILQRQLAEVRAAGLTETLLVGRWTAARPANVRHVPDVVENSGALGGLYSALLAAWTPAVFVLAGDLPFVSAALIRHLTQLGAEDVVVPRTAEGWHPLCAVYQRRVALSVKRRLDRGLLRISDWLADLQIREIGTHELAWIDADDMLLMNVNSPDDLRRAERHARDGR
jgi:molybdenum cofactor guanylyltransferase